MSRESVMALAGFVGLVVSAWLRDPLAVVGFLLGFTAAGLNIDRKGDES